MALPTSGGPIVFREATAADLPGITRVRISVVENALTIDDLAERLVGLDQRAVQSTDGDSHRGGGEHLTELRLTDPQVPLGVPGRLQQGLLDLLLLVEGAPAQRGGETGRQLPHHGDHLGGEPVDPLQFRLREQPLAEQTSGSISPRPAGCAPARARSRD